MPNIAANVLPRNRARAPKRRKITLFEEHVFHQWVTNVWASGLTPSEFKVLTAVFARTVAWGKMWEVIPTRHFQNGIRSAGDTLHYAGTGLSRPTIFKCLARLIGEGYILSRACGQSRAYAVNMRVMGTAADPAYTRHAKRAESARLLDHLKRAQRAAIVAAEAAYREAGTQEARDTWLALLGPSTARDNVVQLPVRKRTRSAEQGAQEQAENPNEARPIALPTGKKSLPINKEHKPSDDASLRSAPSEAARDAHLPRRRERIPVEANSTEAPAHWRDRQARTRRRVDNAPENIPVLDYARNAPGAPPAPHHAERVNAALASATGDTPQGDEPITQVLGKIAETIAMRRRKKLAKRVAKVDDLEAAWRNGVTARCTGYHPPAWTPKQRGQVRNVIQSVDLFDPAMTWGLVVDWVARNFGTATSLAVPFMLRDLDKRDSILRAQPSLSLFLRFAHNYVEAYATLFHGEGFTEEDTERARMDGRLHDQWVARIGAVRQQGYDNLDRRHMTNGELEQLVERLARDDEQAQAVLEAREEHRELARRLRRAYGPRYREMLETHIARERIRQARMEQADDAGIPTQDLSGYMED